MTNREEVAKKLRKSGEYMGDFKKDHYYGFYQIAEDVGLDEGDFFDEWELIRAKCNRLADLMDPTCEVVGVPDNDEFMIRVVSGFECKKCGHEAIVERNCGGWAEPPKYCPNCGARVVRDDG